MQSDRWISATLRDHRDLTDDIREFRLTPESASTNWRGGSHIAIELALPGRTEIRHYSLVGTPGAEWRIAVKRLQPGRGGSEAMWSLEPGVRLRVSEPVSRFELLPTGGPILLIAAGIGITPLYGMALTLLRRHADFRLLYAGRSRRHMAYLDELQTALGDKLMIFAADDGHRLNLAKTIADLPRQGELYLCGPLPMLEDARRLWQELGRPAGGLHFESFASSGNYPSAPFRVTIPGLAADVAVPPESTILSALTAAGVELLSGCRRGECGLCAVDVVSVDGVVDHRDVFFSAAQHQANRKICTCVSRMHGGSITLDIGYRP
jgi:ferredoxin-NADP reductase